MKRHHEYPVFDEGGVPIPGAVAILDESQNFARIALVLPVKPRIRVIAGRRQITMIQYLLRGSQWRPGEREHINAIMRRKRREGIMLGAHDAEW